MQHARLALPAAPDNVHQSCRYEDVAEAAFGSKGREVVSLTLYTELLGTCALFLILQKGVQRWTHSCRRIVGDTAPLMPCSPPVPHLSYLVILPSFLSGHRFACQVMYSQAHSVTVPCAGRCKWCTHVATLGTPLSCAIVQILLL